MGQAEGQAESEQGALACCDEGRGQRTKVGFADESAEGGQGSPAIPLTHRR